MRASAFIIAVAVAAMARAAHAEPAAGDWAADRYFDPATMAAARSAMIDEHGKGRYSMVLANIAEYRGGGGFAWEGEAWAGGDLKRFVLKTEGEGDADGALESGEVQGLYGRAIGPYYNMLVGVRQDVVGPGRTYASIGVEGLSPYFIETEASAFVSSHGEVSARFAASTDWRVTQRLILQPRAEANLALQNSPRLRTGAGLSEAELGLRLRYEIRRQFAPYVGVNWTRSFGRTARYLRADGERAGRATVVAGLRAWF